MAKSRPEKKFGCLECGDIVPVMPPDDQYIIAHIKKA